MLSSMISFPKHTSIFTTFPHVNPRKLVISGSHSVSSATNMSFSGKHYVFFKNRPALTRYMTRESIKTRISRGVSGDEDISAFRKEYSVDVFSPKLAASSFESTLNHLSKWLGTALFGCIIFNRPDAEALWAAIGFISNMVLSNALKQILNQERPVSRIRPASVSDPGMPSSHAQSVFFAVSFPILSIVKWLGMNLLSVTLTGVLVAFASYISWLRVVQEFHTVNQVAVGAVVGSVFSMFWFWFWDAVMSKLFISYLWVRISLFVCSILYFFAFLLYVIRYWID